MTYKVIMGASGYISNSFLTELPQVSRNPQIIA